ncbi:MAG: zf-HC2 domain-containing protein [Verrucomicrobia bacterium]|nr:zf-HC2 domain-containing protein [Verrucomicrobiota bacterium]
MNCDSASPYLDAFVDGELDSGVECALEEHLRNCSACQSAVWEIREFRSQFQGIAPRFKAPLQLRARVLSITYRSRVKPSFSMVRHAWIAAAAVLILSTIVVFLASAPDHSNELSKEAAIDYSRSISAQPIVELASADFSVLKPWFSKKVGFAPPAIDLRDYGYELAGGRVALLGKRPVVALMYKRANDVLIIYCWPPQQEPVGYSQRSVSGCRVYIWANSQCNYVLVERSDDPKISQFVDSFQDQTAPVSY